MVTRILYETGGGLYNTVFIRIETGGGSILEHTGAQLSGGICLIGFSFYLKGSSALQSSRVLCNVVTVPVPGNKSGLGTYYAVLICVEMGSLSIFEYAGAQFSAAERFIGEEKSNL